jgi:hypothetical protein
MVFRHWTLRPHRALPLGVLCFAIALCVSVIVVGVGRSGASTRTTTTTTSPSSTTVMSGTGYVGHPVGVPSGAVATVADCPADPSWSAPLPSGVTVSPPFLGTSNSGSVTITTGGHSTTVSNAGQCGYTLTVPGSPDPYVSYFGGLSYYAPINSEFGLSEANTSQQVCNTNAELGNFGSAYAKQELLSTYCNVDSSGIWGYAQITNGSYQSGSSAKEEPNLNQFYQSSVSGSALYATFQVCLQNPVGQQVYYDCTYNYFGPYF